MDNEITTVFNGADDVTMMFGGRRVNVFKARTASVYPPAAAVGSRMFYIFRAQKASKLDVIAEREHTFIQAQLRAIEILKDDRYW